MTRKNALQELMTQRTPLGSREAVAPADLYTSPQVDKTASPQDREATSAQIGKPTKPQIEKYTTHLRPETIKAVKRTALDHDKKDYEIVQQALDAFFERSGGA